VLIYLFGPFGIKYYRHLFLPLSPLTLLFATSIFLYQHRNINKYLSSYFFVALIGFTAEVVGVATGKVFGVYQYGNALGIKFLDVPLVISINWALLVCASHILANYIAENRIIVAMLTAIITVLVDVLIEPNAPKLDFWYWQLQQAPLHNYIGWFVISFLAAWLMHNKIKSNHYKMALLIIGLHIYFFTTLYFLG
jgi:bisanhydrobacterioruberin hydratase